MICGHLLVSQKESSRTLKFANLYVDSKEYKNLGEDMMIFSIFNLYHHMGIDFDSIVRIPVSQLRNYDGEDVILPVNYPIYGRKKIKREKRRLCAREGMAPVQYTSKKR